MHETLTFVRDLATAPSKAAGRIRRPDHAMTQALRVYALFLGVTILFYTLKPADFPPPPEEMAQLGLDERLPGGLLFWTKVQLWEPLLRAVWVVYMGWFAGMLARPGSLRGRLLLATAAGLAPLIPIALFKAMPHWAFALSWAVLIAAMVPGLRRQAPSSWTKLVSLAMAVTALNLVMAPAFTAAVLARAPLAYEALEIGLLFWTLWLGAVLLNAVGGLSTPRAFAAVFLSLLSQLLFVISMYLLGLLPTDILKALMTV